MRKMMLMALVAAIGLAGVVGEAGAQQRKGGGERPNIVWISVEDISARLGCYGDERAITPTLDRLATEGVRYTRAFGHAGVCAVNRTGIITSMYPTTIGTQHMRCQGVPPAYVKCFPEYLRAAGYYTSNNSKTDYNFAPPPSAWDESSNKAHWRNRPDKAQPFFAVFNLTTTHESQIRAPKERFEANTKRLTAAERQDPSKLTLPPYYPDTPVVRRDLANLYELITAMDKQVADLLGQLEEDGLAENTIVWFWSDHGDGLPRAKRWIYDSGLHVPMIVRFGAKWRHLSPGRAGSTYDELVAFIDYGATVLSLAGIEPPSHMQGRPFLGRYKAEPRPYIYAARDRMDETYDLIRAVRDKRYKYIRNFEPGKPYAQPIAYMDEMPTIQEWRRLAAEGKLSGVQMLWMAASKPIEELYDTQADPWEVENLAGSAQHRPILQRMRAELERWQEETGDLGLIPEAELWEQRRPGGVWSVTAKPEAEVVKSGKGSALKLRSETEGASIVWAVGEENRWRLYTGPIPVREGEVVRYKACRLGWRDSEVGRHAGGE